MVRVEQLGKQVISPEGPLLILDNLHFSIARGERGRDRRLRFRQVNPARLLAGLDTPTRAGSG